LRVAAARGSPPYGRPCALKPGDDDDELLLNVADPAYGAKAEPEEERPSSSVRGPNITLEPNDGHECSASDTDGGNRKPGGYAIMTSFRYFLPKVYNWRASKLMHVNKNEIMIIA